MACWLLVVSLIDAKLVNGRCERVSGSFIKLRPFPRRAGRPEEPVAKTRDSFPKVERWSCILWRLSHLHQATVSHCEPLRASLPAGVDRSTCNSTGAAMWTYSAGVLIISQVQRACSGSVTFAPVRPATLWYHTTEHPSILAASTCRILASNPSVMAFAIR